MQTIAQIAKKAKAPLRRAQYVAKRLSEKHPRMGGIKATVAGRTYLYDLEDALKVCAELRRIKRGKRP